MKVSWEQAQRDMAKSEGNCLVAIALDDMTPGSPNLGGAQFSCIVPQELAREVLKYATELMGKARLRERSRAAKVARTSPKR